MTDHYIYTANVGTILASCDDSRPYESKKDNGVQLIGLQKTICIKANNSIIRDYKGKCGRKLPNELDPEPIEEKDFENALNSAEQMKHHQENILKIRNKYS